MNDEWYVYLNDAAVGPYAVEQLRKLFATKELDPASFVRRGDEPWTPAAEAFTAAEGVVLAEAEAVGDDADNGEPSGQPEADDSAEYAIATEVTASEIGPMISVATAPTHSSANSSTRSQSATQRRTKKWTQNSTLMFAAAIIVGGLAAILVGKLILWLVQPAPKRTYGPYAAVTLPHFRGERVPRKCDFIT